MAKDTLIDCPLCKEAMACYSTSINETKNAYVCLGCGFSSNDLLVEGEYNSEEYENEFPELYKEIKKTDSLGRVWYPNIVNIPDKGVVFVSGVTSEEWEWSAIKNIPLTKEELEMPKFKGQTYKSDSKSLKDFGRDYLSALEYINVEL